MRLLEYVQSDATTSDLTPEDHAAILDSNFHKRLAAMLNLLERMGLLKHMLAATSDTHKPWEGKAAEPLYAAMPMGAWGEG